MTTHFPPPDDDDSPYGLESDSLFSYLYADDEYDLDNDSYEDLYAGSDEYEDAELPFANFDEGGE